MSPHHAERSQLLYLFQPDNNKGRSLVKLFLLKKTVLHISVISVRKQFFISVRKLDPNQGTQQNVPKQNGKLYITFRSIGQKKTEILSYMCIITRIIFCWNFRFFLNSKAWIIFKASKKIESGMSCKALQVSEWIVHTPSHPRLLQNHNMGDVERGFQIGAMATCPLPSNPLPPPLISSFPCLIYTVQSGKI